MRKSKKHQEADTFDADLYELILRAARFEREWSNNRGTAGHGWIRIANRLSAIRPKVRALMHPEDRKGTKGA